MKTKKGIIKNGELLKLPECDEVLLINKEFVVYKNDNKYYFIAFKGSRVPCEFTDNHGDFHWKYFGDKLVFFVKNVIVKSEKKNLEQLLLSSIVKYKRDNLNLPLNFNKAIGRIS